MLPATYIKNNIGNCSICVTMWAHFCLPIMPKEICWAVVHMHVHFCVLPNVSRNWQVPVFEVCCQAHSQVSFDHGSGDDKCRPHRHCCQGNLHSMKTVRHSFSSLFLLLLLHVCVCVCVCVCMCVCVCVCTLRAGWRWVATWSWSFGAFRWRVVLHWWVSIYCCPFECFWICCVRMHCDAFRIFLKVHAQW